MRTRRTRQSTSKSHKAEPAKVTPNARRIEAAAKRVEHTEALTDNAAMRIEQAEASAERPKRLQVDSMSKLLETPASKAEILTELAKTRIEQAEIRTELAKARTEQAEIRVEQAETRAEQAESTLKRLVKSGPDLRQHSTTLLFDDIRADVSQDQTKLLEQLTGRQREVLELVAIGRNTKEVGSLLKISAKTVEYHRMKLMKVLNLHDIPSLVRFALRVRLIPPES